MSRRQTDPLNPVSLLILGLTLVLLVAWFYRDRSFEPLIGILAALDFLLLWITSRYPRLAAISIVFALGVFVLGLFFVLQQENGQPSKTPTPTSSAVGSFATASPDPTFAPLLPTNTSTPPPPTPPTITPSPPSSPTPSQTTAVTTSPIITVNDNTQLARLLPPQHDLPQGISHHNSEVISVREVAEGDPIAADSYLQLIDWGSRGGYRVAYDAGDICSTSVDYQVVTITFYLFEDVLGAENFFASTYSEIQNRAQIYTGQFWDFQDIDFGDQGFQFRGDVLFCLGIESSQYHSVVFRRYNVVAEVSVAAFDSLVERYSQYVADRSRPIANTIDLNIVAEVFGQ